MAIKKVIFRVDASSEIGFGHLYRCLALADMISSVFQCEFHTCTEIESALQMISRKYPITKLNSANHINEFLTKLEGNEIVVLDNYFFTSDYQKEIKQTGARLVCIDDTHDKHYHADIVINHAPGILASDFSCDNNTKLLLGLKYLLLRKSFLHNARVKKSTKNKGNLFVCFGGSDIRNITTTIATTLDSCQNLNHVDIVIGGGYEHSRDLKKVLESVATSVTLHEAISEEQMIIILNNTSAAIVPASMMLLETLTAQIPVLTGMYIDNQRFLHQYFSNNITGIETIDFTSDILTASHIDRLMISEAPTEKLIDGLSNYRLHNEFIRLAQPEISWRKAEPNDCQLYFDWANDPEVRTASYHENTITLEDHTNWFRKKISSVKTAMYLFQFEGAPFGQVRFEIDNCEAVIGVSIDSAYRSKKLASTILAIASNQFLIDFHGITVIWAFIKKENIRSSKAFIRAGFVEESERIIEGVESLVLARYK